ncbi:hypothetical protein F5887DRAFT_1000147, partial [Amanita rubescens]
DGLTKYKLGDIIKSPANVRQCVPAHTINEFEQPLQVSQYGAPFSFSLILCEIK